MPLFGRKKQSKPQLFIELAKADGSAPLTGKVSVLPLSEAKIVEYSIEFFDDPTPCVIHKSAVQERLFGEWEKELASRGEEGCVSLSELPERFGAMLDAPEAYTTVKWYYQAV